MARVMRSRAADVWLLLGSLSILIVGGVVSLSRHLPPASATAPVVGRADAGGPWTRRSLAPVPNPDPEATPQPHRCRPYRVAASADGEKAYVTLAGKEIAPGSEVAVLDVASRRETKRVAVGSYPYAIATHPSGRFVVVTNRYSNFLSVIDAATDEVTSEIPALFYCEEIAFSPDGATAYLANFWKNQVLVVDLEESGGRLTGRLRERGFDRSAFFGAPVDGGGPAYACGACGFAGVDPERCARCGFGPPERLAPERRPFGPGGVRAVLRSRCGTSGCHLDESGGGFYAGPDAERLFRSAAAHAFPEAPGRSPLLRATTASRDGGWADAVDGRHHAGGVVFERPEIDPDYRPIADWIASGAEGPGIAVGHQPRDMVISPDGKTLYVANSGSLDVSVVDLETGRETRRLFTRSPVNDVVLADGRLVLATLGVGSGHPKARDAGRESTDPAHPEAEFSLVRDPETGKPLPLEKQRPLGPFDDTDGTAQEKFRDITNDIVICDPACGDVAAYRAEEAFTRYTSDTFEALPGDVKGDVPEELLQVAGAFPEQIARRGETLYVTMSGTFEVQEWTVDAAAPPARRLVPGRVFSTGLKPSGIAVAGETLVVADHIGESVTFIDVASGGSETLSLGRLEEPFPATDFERGELFVQTSVFSVDQDQSCVHCHYRDTNDGKAWSVSQVMGQSRSGEERTGGSRQVPDMRALVHKVPFFVEGTLSMDEPLTMIMEQNPLIDFQGATPVGDFTGIVAAPDEEAKYAKSADMIVLATGRWSSKDVRLADLAKRREVHFARLSRKYLGAEYSIRDLQKFVGAYQGEEPRLLANPEDPGDPMVRRGRALFEDPRVGCSQCHPAPAFTDKVHVHNQNRAFPPLVTPAPRDDAHGLVSADRLDAINGFVRPWDPDDRGRVEENESFFVAPSLRGVWAKPPRMLHHGHALALREIVCTPDHPALRPFPFPRREFERPLSHERGLNALDGVPDTHGVTSHLSVFDIECLLRYLRSIE